MNYEPQGIQQQGWPFQIGAENRIEPTQHRKGARSQSGKACIHCGGAITGRTQNQYCSLACKHERIVARWLPCSECMAKIGIGAQTAAKLLGIVSNCNVSRQWQKRGIKRAKPSGKQNWRDVAGAMKMSEAEINQIISSAWMQEVKNNGRTAIYPDWSYLWTKELAKKASLAKYRALTMEERREREKKRCPKKKRQSMNNWRREQRKNNPEFRMIENFRTRLSFIMKGAMKDAPTKELIGCTPSELRQHIEAQFRPWMTWDNYGTRWHIDHILPVASFDHSDPKQIRVCWHFSNLRPLCKKANGAKSDKITQPQMNLPILAVA